ncbi:hypothetical protein BYT27DRAFT_7125865, partial [Phlegmacium glaucopus]
VAHYYSTRPCVIAVPNASNEGEAASEDASEFDKHCETLLSDDAEEGWAPELRRYLKMMQRDVKKDTNIVKWWQVSSLSSLGPIVFEEVTITKLAWGPGLCDIAAWNAVQMEEVAHLDLDFEQMLVDDGDQDKWDKSMPGLDLDWFS